MVLHFLESFYFYTMQRKCLHILVELVERYARGRSRVERSKRMTVLAFAIWCKMQHSNSVMFDMNTRDLMRSLHIGHTKAQMILKAIKSSELFSVQEDGRFIVNSFKDNTIKRNKKGRVFKGANMFTIEVSKEITLKEIYNRLNELLFLHQIGSMETNSSHVSANNRSCRYSYIPFSQLESAVGMSHGSISGIKKRLKGKKEISSTFAEMHMADSRCGDQVKNLLAKFGRNNPSFVRDNNVYVCIPCSYAITDRKAKASCGRHIIYGYAGKKASKKGITRQGRGLYSQMQSLGNLPD